MNKTKFMNTPGKRFALHGLSIQQRLPLLICVLLLSIMITFSWISYIGVKNAALKTGKDRLVTLAGQFSSMLSQNAQALVTMTHAAAGQESFKKYLESGASQFKTEASEALNKLRPDSIWVSAELLNSSLQPVLRSGKDSSSSTASGFDSLSAVSVHNEPVPGVGKIYLLKGLMYYPTSVPVTDNKRIIGHLVRWRSVTASPATLEQLSQLMGTKAKLYVGNKDGSLWTDMMKPVPYQQLDTSYMREPFEYSNIEHSRMIAAARPITNSSWLIVIEFPRKNVTEAANLFLQWIIIIGGVLVAIGIFAAWIMSRNITRPLNKLTVAASMIADGDYSSPVDVDRNDELGKLALAFNSMAIQVRNSKLDLEKKVAERTNQLETVNKELEAFTYSISHDLRSPLRGIIGFTTILEEDYGHKLDDEAKRITSIIKNNTLKMGHLIDGLLTFSRMERQDIAKMKISTELMVKEVIDSLQQQAKRVIEWNIQSLPDIKGDTNMIRQVWVNLISNAIKYSSKKEQPHIDIGTFSETGQTFFYIRDNGVGFNEQYKHKLFKVFQRLHGVDEFEGTGIGLALVDKIISRHGGRVWAEAEIHKGASFYFGVPGE